MVVVTGHPDIGGSRASMVNIVAEMLGIDYRKVQALIGDTSSIGFSALTGGSRVTFAAGLVVTKAAEQVIQTLRERAAKIWKIDVEAVVWENGEARPAGANAGEFPPLSAGGAGRQVERHRRPDQCGLLAQHRRRGGPALRRTSAMSRSTRRPARFRSYATRRSRTSAGPSIRATWRARSRAASPRASAGPCNEECIFGAKGLLDNPSFLDYRMPVASDLPMIEPVLIEVPNDKHPQGIRGVGEVPHRAGTGGSRQRHPQRHRPAPDRPADVPAQGAGGPDGRQVGEAEAAGSGAASPSRRGGPSRSMPTGMASSLKSYLG